MTKRHKDLYRKVRRQRRIHKLTFSNGSSVSFFGIEPTNYELWKGSSHSIANTFSLEELVRAAENFDRWHRSWLESWEREKILYVSHERFQKYVEQGVIDKEGRWL